VIQCVPHAVQRAAVHRRCGTVRSLELETVPGLRCGLRAAVAPGTPESLAATRSRILNSARLTSTIDVGPVPVSALVGRSRHHPKSRDVQADCRRPPAVASSARGRAPPSNPNHLAAAVPQHLASADYRLDAATTVAENTSMFLHKAGQGSSRLLWRAR
jgi:hypothetical protein